MTQYDSRQQEKCPPKQDRPDELLTAPSTATEKVAIFRAMVPHGAGGAGHSEDKIIYIQARDAADALQVIGRLVRGVKVRAGGRTSKFAFGSLNIKPITDPQEYAKIERRITNLLL